MLWFNNVLPTLLPFMIATNMLISLGFAEFLSRVLSPVMKKIFRLPGEAAFGLVAGITSGYPMGAKTVADLKNTGRLTTREAQHLLAFCNNAGPLFILGVVGVGMFENLRVGYFLWISHVLAAFVVGILLRPGKKTEHDFDFFARKKRENTPSNVHSTGKVLGDAVKNSMESILTVGGLIIFFSVVTALSEKLILSGGSLFSGVAAGIIEITGGAKKISALEHTAFSVACTAFIIAFGGISVHAQSLHFIAGTGIKTRDYFFAKILHGLIAAGIMILIYDFECGTLF